MAGAGLRLHFCSDDDDCSQFVVCSISPGLTAMSWTTYWAAVVQWHTVMLLQV